MLIGTRMPMPLHAPRLCPRGMAQPIGRLTSQQSLNLGYACQMLHSFEAQTTKLVLIPCFSRFSLALCNPRLPPVTGFAVWAHSSALIATNTLQSSVTTVALRLPLPASAAKFVVHYTLGNILFLSFHTNTYHFCLPYTYQKHNTIVGPQHQTSNGLSLPVSTSFSQFIISDI